MRKWTHYLGTYLLLTLGSVCMPNSGLHAETAPPSMGMDTLGNVVAVWGTDACNAIYAARYNTLTQVWSTPTIISSPGGVYDPMLAMDSAGNAVAVWKSDSGNYTNVSAATVTAGSTVWTSPVVISALDADVYNLDYRIKMNNTNKVMVMWKNSRCDIFSATLTIGGSWSAPQKLFTNPS